MNETRLTETERETITRAGFSAYDHLLQREPTLLAVEAILTARLAKVEALVSEWRASLIECVPTSPRDVGWGQGAEHCLEALEAALSGDPGPEGSAT